LTRHKDSKIDVEWLVDERSKVQRLSVNLLHLIDLNQRAILDDEKALAAVLLMIGAAFSMWRAIFLAYVEPDESRTRGAMRALSTAVPTGTIPQRARPARGATRACHVTIRRYARMPLLMPSGDTFPAGSFFDQRRT
jgi:hypothetical protein